MKKWIYILIFWTLSICGFGQGYKSVSIEKKNIDFDNVIFKPGVELTYSYEILKDSVSLDWSRNETGDIIWIDDTIASDGVKQIQVFVLNAKRKNRTNKNQTEIVYYYPRDKKFESTGIVENSNNIWIHPPRSSVFSSLETCPFPYIRFGLDNWEDKMEISSHWSDPLWGVWQGSLPVEYSYEGTDITLQTERFGWINGVRVTAKANSKIGKTSLNFTYSDSLGFVELDYLLATDIRIRMQLISKKTGKVHQDLESLIHAIY